MLAYRGEGVSRRPPRLVTVYVLGALQLACAGALLAAACGYWASPLAGRDWRAALLFTSLGVIALAGLVAAGGMVFWRWARWRVTAVAQAVYFAAHVVGLVAGCATLGPSTLFLSVVILPALALAGATLVYLHREDFRSACAWRTSDVWRQWNPEWATGQPPDPDEAPPDVGT